MLLTIENAFLQVTVDSLGAQLRSIQGKTGIQYLWQGDPAYWTGQAPVLFPVIGRLEGKKYTLSGQEFPLNIHGFAAAADFVPTVHSANVLTLSLSDSPATREQYPQAFTLEITYRLEGETLLVENRVHNLGQNTMHFALGGHPGFRVPWDGGQFTDYYLEFSQPCQPDRIGFTQDTVLVNGCNVPYPLQQDTRLELRHDLFDEDAIILQNMARQVQLKSHTGKGSITVSYPDMPYLGIWHWPKKDAPYVCIEPWTSLPGRSGVTENLACRSDFVHLAPGLTWENIWSISVSQ